MEIERKLVCLVVSLSLSFSLSVSYTLPLRLILSRLRMRLSKGTRNGQRLVPLSSQPSLPHFLSLPSSCVSLPRLPRVLTHRRHCRRQEPAKEAKAPAEAHAPSPPVKPLVKPSPDDDELFDEDEVALALVAQHGRSAAGRSLTQRLPPRLPLRVWPAADAASLAAAPCPPRRSR